MPANKNSRVVDDIDENFLLQSIKEKDDVPKEAAKPALQTEKPEKIEKPENTEISETPDPVPEKPKETRRRRNQADYSSIFLQRNELKERSCVYISKRIHNTISEIVRCIANRDVTVGGYIDSVLLQHLEAHKDEINELYKKERKDLIEF